MQRSILVTAIVAVGVGGAVGYWLGSPSPAVQVEPVFDQAAVEQGRKRPSAGDTSSGWQTFKPAAKAAGGAVTGTEDEEGQSEAFHDPRIANLVRDQALATADQLALALAGDPLTPGHQAYIQQLKQALLDKASNDSLALQGLIDTFSADPASALGKQLGSLLAEIKDPEVEAMAQQMVRSGGVDQMKAGLEVLSGLGIPSEETLHLTQQIINQPTADPDLLMGAISAMPVMPVTQQETAEVIGGLARLADQHPNDGVRSNSLFKIAEWAKDGEDLHPVMQALDKNREPDDRISAAMALAQSTVATDEVRSAALARMTDPSELWEVRRYSAEALQRFKLSGQEHQLLESFRREQLDLQNNG